MKKRGIFKPMKGADNVTLENVKLPVMASPKIDGYRLLVREGVALSSNMTPVRNKLIQSMFGNTKLNGLDGELTAGPPNGLDVHHRTSSLFTSYDNTDDELMFTVFDHFGYPDDEHHVRADIAASVVKKFRSKNVQFVNWDLCESVEEVVKFEKLCVENGYEGMMLRDPDGPYKYGRSTINEGWLLKVKRFVDAEAVIVGFVERLHNTNEATRDELGRNKRSHKMENRHGTGMVGSAIAIDVTTGNELRIKGFSHDLARRMWKNQSQYIGAVATYSHFPHGAVERRRHSSFKRFRMLMDMDAKTARKVRAILAQRGVEPVRKER